MGSCLGAEQPRVTSVALSCFILKEQRKKSKRKEIVKSVFVLFNDSANSFVQCPSFTVSLVLKPPLEPCTGDFCHSRQQLLALCGLTCPLKQLT